MERDLLKSRLAKLPDLPPIDPDRHLELTDDDKAEEALDSFDPTAPAVLKPRRRPLGVSYSPLSAEGYFTTALEVDSLVRSVYQPLNASSTAPASSDSSGTAVFRVYYTPPPAPPPSSPATISSSFGLSASGATEDEEEGGGGNGVVFVCVHGAGYSGLSWACLAKELAERTQGKSRVGILAYDARGHGKTRLPLPAEGESDIVDMSLQTMAQDLCALLKTMYPDRDSAPSLVLVGHSMGGAVVAEACNRVQEDVADVTGVVVVDVVEGTALEALSGMSALIAAHPKKFSSPEEAILWHIQSKTINNVDSARVSVPPLVKPLHEGASNYGWRVDLQKTEPYWRGWFAGLSARFLSCKAAKLLLLAGTDRLDRELLIGQMQGKYQLEVDPLVGHCVHEDAPGRTADTLLSFWQRNDRTDMAQILRRVKKVGDPA
ncbi:hypothetical protein JCM6882_005914 [Rhodosporidiobolus microsporus]